MVQGVTQDDRPGIDPGWKPGEGVLVRHEFDREKQPASADVTDQRRLTGDLLQSSMQAGAHPLSVRDQITVDDLVKDRRAGRTGHRVGVVGVRDDKPSGRGELINEAR